MNIWDQFSIVFSDGLLPNMKVLVDFFMGDGLYLGILVIFLPLLGRLIKFFKHLF